MTCVPLSTYIPARISDLLVRMRVALDADDKSYFWDLSEALIEIACVDRASYTLQDFQVRYRDLMREKNHAERNFDFAKYRKYAMRSNELSLLRKSCFSGVCS